MARISLILFSFLIKTCFSNENCCYEKEVGSIKYKWVEENYSKTGAYGCIDGCIYEKYENQGGKKYCFATGQQMAKCLDQQEKEGYWSYSGKYGTENWGKYFPDCNGQSQSPIDIVYNGETAPEPEPLLMSNYDKVRNIRFSNTEENIEGKEGRLENGTWKNNGHTAQLDVFASTDAGVLSGGNLDGSYQILQLHFHWGVDDTVGSEHTLNGQSYPIELHIVHVKQGLEEGVSPLEVSNGLAVTGFFFEVSKEDNAALAPLVSALANIKEANSKEPMIDSAFKLSDLIRGVAPVGGDSATRYSTYPGSLTTPGCAEVVHWINFLTPLNISSSQLEAFRMIDDSKDMSIVDNFRPPQPLNGRTVKFFG